MSEDHRHEPVERVSVRAPTHRETLAVMWLAIFNLGLEALFLAGTGGSLLALLFVITNWILVALLFHWLHYLLSNDRLALLWTSVAAAAVLWVTCLLFRAYGLAEAELLWGLISPYALMAVGSAVVAAYKRTWQGRGR
jgi:hypothetical protein